MAGAAWQLFQQGLLQVFVCLFFIDSRMENACHYCIRPPVHVSDDLLVMKLYNGTYRGKICTWCETNNHDAQPHLSRIIESEIIRRGVYSIY